MTTGLSEAPRAGIALTELLRRRELELRQLAAQLSRNYEEITLLHQLTRESQVSQGARELQTMALNLLAGMLPVPQIAYVDWRGEHVYSTGEALLQSRQCHELISSLGSRATHSVIVDNRVSQRESSPDFSRVQRLICVPVVAGREQFGWLLAVGTPESSELGSVEASLMTAVAAILATHQTNVKLYGNLKELFLGVVRALSSAIDAKDSYTCGHSERVAWLARQLARQMGLTEEDQNRVYLSGLLHDVGKIGVRDSVLLKPGQLTDEERSHIREHPKIGFDILSGVRQLKPVLSGVRSHHENVDGNGYPDGLRGEEISLMARIVAVADAYDAMSTDRPYRGGRSAEQIERVFREGAGKQWDEQVVEAFLAIQQTISQKHATASAVQFTDDASEAGGPAADSTNLPLDLNKISKFISLSVA